MKPATTIGKVCRVLGEFRNRPSIGVTDLARTTGLLPSDVHRILASLKIYGFVEQDPETRTYRLGMGLMKLGLAVFQRNELCERARPFLLKLSEETEATAHLAIFDRRELDIFLAEQIDCAREIPFKAKYGATTSVHCTALGKAIMANLDGETVQRLLEKNGMRKTTPRTITGWSDLRVELAKTNDQGYGVDLEESVEGACCIGAPIRDWSGATVGAISISMAAERFYTFHQPGLAAAVKSAASQVSHAIGYQSGPPFSGSFNYFERPH